MGELLTRAGDSKIVGSLPLHLEYFNGVRGDVCNYFVLSPILRAMAKIGNKYLEKFIRVSVKNSVRQGKVVFLV